MGLSTLTKWNELEEKDKYCIVSLLCGIQKQTTRTNDIKKQKHVHRGGQQTSGHQREAEWRRGRVGKEGQLWGTEGTGLSVVSTVQCTLMSNYAAAHLKVT